MAKSCSNSTFLACFDLIVSGIFLMTSFNEICLVKHIFNILLTLFPILAPFRVVMFCKNGPKILQIDISCRFWPNNVWKLFYYIILWHIFSWAYFQKKICHLGRVAIARRTCCITFFFEMFLFEYIFKIFLSLCPYLTKFRHLSWVMLCKKWPKFTQK